MKTDLGLILALLALLVIVVLGPFKLSEAVMNVTHRSILWISALLSVLFASVTPHATFAATRYVAQAAGTFSGGTACNGQTAITYSSWNSLTLSPGDLTYVCGTITISGSGAVGFNFRSNSGSSVSPLILRFDTGAAIVCNPYCGGGGGGSNGGAIALGTGNSYITIDGNNLQGTVANGYDGSPNAACYLGTCNVQHSTTLISGWSCTNCIIQNLNMIDAYVNTTGDSSIGDSSTVTAFEGSGSGLTISGNYVHDCGWCFFVQQGNAQDNFTFANNQVFNYAHGLAFANQTGAAVDQEFVYSNNIHDSANWGATGCFAHIDSLHIFGSSTSSVDHFYFYNNYIHGNWGTCPTGAIFVEGGGSSTPSHLKNSYWFNNIIDASQGPTNLTQGWMGIFAGDSGVQLVYNNTIMGPNGTDNTLCYAFSGESGSTNMSALTFENNVAAPCGNPVAIGVSGYGVTLTASNYNFYGQYGSNAFTWQSKTAGSFSAWKTACSCDASAVQNNTALLNTNGAPQSGSPVIGKATNLTSLATGDLAALQYSTTEGGEITNPPERPSSGNWDIGAYLSSVALGSPTGLSGSVTTAP